MAYRGPNLPIDLDVHLLIKFFWQLKRNLVDTFSREDVFVELFDVLGESPYLGILIEMSCPLLKALYGKPFLKTIAFCLDGLNDLNVFLSEIFQ